jgi:hypothetical protein
VLKDIPVDVICMDILGLKKPDLLKKEQIKNKASKLKNVTKIIDIDENALQEEDSGINYVTNVNGIPGIVHSKNVTKSQYSVSMQKVTSEPPVSSSKKCYDKIPTGPIMHKFKADSGVNNDQKKSSCVSMQKVTLKPGESRFIYDTGNLQHGTIMHKKEADAPPKNDTENMVSVSIKKVTSKVANSSSNEDLENIEDALNLQRKQADAKLKKKIASA